MSGAEDSRLVRTFVELARIPSPSFQEGRVAEYLVRALSQAGCDVRVDDSAAQTGSDTGNVIAVLPGDPACATVALSAHMDTVEPAFGVEPVVRDGRVFSAGDTVLGADDKVGIAVALEAVRTVFEDRMPHGDIVCVFTVGEEKGLVGAKALDLDDLRADVCLVLDADGTPGGIVVGSPTHYTFKATFRGRAAHAGVEPERGVSALLAAARAVTTMPHGRLDDETTANVGSIEGGSATNVVPDRVDITGECRSRDGDKVERVRARMTDAMRSAAEQTGAEVEVDWTKEYEAVTFDEGDPALEMIEAALRDAGVEPVRVVTGGGSDANVLFEKGLPAVALATGVEGFHTTEESVAVEDMRALLKIVLAVIARAAG